MCNYCNVKCPCSCQSESVLVCVRVRQALGQWQSLGRKIEKATKLNRMLEQRNRMLKEDCESCDDSIVANYLMRPVFVLAL